MSKPLLTVVIPTWNRKPLVEVAIDSICSQIGKLPVELIVSDHGSTDGTFEMLKEKRKTYPMLNPYVCRRVKEPDFSHNFQFAFGLPESRWTWTFGDDDKMLPGALEKVVQILDDRVPFVHVGESSRTKNTMKVVEGTMMENCNDLGFLDFTGFITGNIIRSDKLKSAVNSANWDLYAQSAFPQSLSLLEALAYDYSAFIDYGMIEAQDRELSGNLRTEDDRGQRWANANIGARYSYIIPALKVLLKHINYDKPLKPSFFRYLSYYLWDRFALDTISTYTGMVINAPHDVFVHHFLWDLFAEMADFLDEENKAKVKAEIYAGRDMMDQHMEAVAAMNKAGQAMDEYCSRHMTDQFPYNYIGAIGERT